MTISNSMKEEILHYLGDNDTTVFVTHLGQDYSRTNGRHVDPERIKRDLGITRKYILFVGFPQYRKNLTGLLKGFANACKELHEPYDLIICGDIETKIESDYPNILRTIDELKFRKYIKFTNYLETDDLQDLITGAEFFAFPSFYEGFGLPVIEAMACGTPVLVSDIPVMREVAGEAGTYIDPYDVDDISRGICQLLLDNDLREKLRIKGKQVASQFTWENTASRTLKCYHQTVKKDT
ncbi:glycosyl transferase group 1 [Candidatus Scalindua japonica]|uniref:Glycosyl transferase group 1 n=2 Tax=Candidatus Scalindua japonica TaxID=1284222 RepID=A0A286TTK0_9BACT|nr:glycosyl transferase group 1 [Candidatus Scalindua japonica]